MKFTLSFHLISFCHSSNLNTLFLFYFPSFFFFPLHFTLPRELVWIRITSACGCLCCALKSRVLYVLHNVLHIDIMTPCAHRSSQVRNFLMSKSHTFLWASHWAASHFCFGSIRLLKLLSSAHSLCRVSQLVSWLILYSENLPCCITESISVLFL